MKLKFENYSLSGIDHRGVGFCLYLPGHSVGDSAMIVDVPDGQVEKLRKHFQANHPVVKITEVAIDEQPAPGIGDVAAPAVDEHMPPPADNTEEEQPTDDVVEEDAIADRKGRRNKR